MKKGLIKTFAGVAALSSLFAVNVHALGVDEGNNSDSTNVVVGEVDTPVYTVGIRWGDFSYHWAYNSETGSYEWKDGKVDRCGGVVPFSGEGDPSPEFKVYTEEEYAEQISAGNIFSDSTCSTVTSDVTFAEVEEKKVYTVYKGVSNTEIIIFDESSLGQVVPSIEWNSTDDYDWTTGEFVYENATMTCELETSETYPLGYAIYYDSDCNNEVTDTEENYQPNTYYKGVYTFATQTTKGGELPDSARFDGGVVCDGDKCVSVRVYDVKFNLGVDEGKTVKTPKVGDTIGTITVSFRAK